MQRIRKIFISALAALLLVALIISAVFLYSPKNSLTVYAARDTSLFKVIGEKDGDSHDDLWQGGVKPFNGNVLKELYKTLLDVETYKDFEQKVNNSGNGVDKAFSSAYFRNANGNKNISIWFAGIKWDIVYLNKNKSADSIILTLWQSADNVTEKSKWAKRDGDPDANIYDSSGTNRRSAYPDSMYSTSLIRVETLNIGGYMSKSATALEENETQQDINNKYARFTMSSGDVKDSVRDYLVQPKDIAYQETENSYETTATNSTLANDAYGNPSGTVSWEDYISGYPNNGDSSKPSTMYAAWQNDYIWLPSLAETGDKNDANEKQNGVWKTDVNLRASALIDGENAYCWLRTGGGYWRSAYYLNEVGNRVGDGNKSNHKASVYFEHYVRPAIHLNLTSANDASSNILPEPSDFAVDYSGEANTIESAAKLNKVPWYVSEIYSAGVEITYADAVTKAPVQASETDKAGKYTVKIEIKDINKSWEESKGDTDKTREITMTVNPAKITVKYDDKFSNKNNYVYHTNEQKHKLRIPEGADGSDYNETYINLGAATDGDKQSVNVYYHIETHDESEHQKFEEEDLPRLKESVKGLEDNDNALTGWAKYTDGDPDLNVNEPKGYCVFYKITADNHETLYDYFSVHIATEILKIKAALTLGTPTFGDEVEYLTGADKLKTYIETQNIITQILDNNNEDRLNKLDKKLFTFYIYQKDSAGDIVKTLDGKTRFDAGDYYLGVRYNVTDNANFIHFVWNSTGTDENGQPKDGEHPKLTVKAKEVALVWKGVEDDEAEKAKVSDKVIANYVDGFSWAYDGNPKMPTATFTDVDNEEQDVTVTVDGEHTDAANYTAKAKAVSNYIFTNATQDYKILKAKNGWKTQFECYDFSVGGDPDEVKAVPYFGTVTQKYYTDATWATPYGKATWEAGTYYVKLTVSESKNYDGLDSSTESDQSIYTFTVNECEHDYLGQPYITGMHGGKEQHWQECRLCQTPGNYEDHSAASDAEFEHNATEHWLVCQYCKEQFAKSSHTYEAGDIKKEAKCNEEGEQEYVCKCGEIDPQVHKLKKSEHVLEQNSENSGNKWYSDGTNHWNLCTVCNAHVGEVGHDKKTYDMLEPTCTDDGHNEYQDCPICGYVFKAKVDIPATGHTLGADKEVRQAATCTVGGWEYGECTVCHKRDLFPTKPLGHQFDKEKIVRAATCTENGEKIMQCSHADCTEVDENTRTVISATGHSYGEWHVKTAATCIAGGVNEHECSNCHATETQPTAPDLTAHKRTTDRVYQAATATRDGWDEHYECEDCHEFLNANGTLMSESTKENLRIPALGTPSVNGGSSSSDWLKDNWWWLVIAVAVILLFILLIFIITSIRNRRREQERLERERERDRQFETFMKMQMMSSYNMGGFAGGGQPDGAVALDGMQYALPPASHEVINVAVTAAIAALRADGTLNDPHAGNMGGANYAGNTSGASYVSPDAHAAYPQPEPPQQPADQPVQGAQGTPYAQPNGQPTAQQYSQPSAQPFITPEPPQPQQQAAQSAQQQAAQPQPSQPSQPQSAQPSQPAFTDNDGFYDSYKKPKYDDDDDEDD